MASTTHAARDTALRRDRGRARRHALEDRAHLHALEDLRLEGSDVHAQHAAVRGMRARSVRMHIIRHLLDAVGRFQREDWRRLGPVLSGADPQRAAL